MRAHADEPLPLRVALEHRVEGRHRTDLRARETEQVADLAHRRRRHVPLLRLGQVQHRQQRASRLAGRVARDERARLLVEPLRQRGRGGVLVRLTHERRVHPAPLDVRHRSTPPMTGSMLATDAITSAIKPPRTICGIAWRLMKLGSRSCTRHGFVPPLETMWYPSSPRGDSIGTYASPAGTLNPSVTSLK